MPQSILNVDKISATTGNVVMLSGINFCAPQAINSNIVVGGYGSTMTPTAVNNTVLGLQSGMFLTDGSNNVAVGTSALMSATISEENVAIGTDSMRSVTTSSYGQISIGHNALKNLATVTADGNTAIGWRALWNATACGGNTVLGYSAGTSVTTGSFNTLIGPSAGGNLTTGSNNICIGKYVSPATATTSDSITLGNSSNNILRCAVTSITSLSDSRDKEDVKDLSTGLDFVKSLRPVEFTWNDRDEAGKHGVADFGFIAQDLKKAQEDAEKAEVLKLVYEENPEKLEASYGKLIPILVKAIQELSAEVTSLKKK